MDEKLAFARRLRRDSTDAEKRLWYQLRGRRFAGYKFRRPRPIGRYVVDFVCIERRLIVEVDGGQHDWGNTRDDIRIAALKAIGYQVIRFWNNDVQSNMEGVLRRIEEALSSDN